MQGKLFQRFTHLLYCSVVNLNSKYKEDDYTDSNASVNSLDVCVHRIHFRNEASTPHMSNPRSSQLPVFSQLKTPKTFTTPSQPWLLHDDDSDTELTAEDTAYT